MSNALAKESNQYLSQKHKEKTLHIFDWDPLAGKRERLLFRFFKSVIVEDPRDYNCNNVTNKV